MRSREMSYRCAVCRWQGQLEPVDAGDAAPCPHCGVYLYPLSWVSTWGLALLIMAGTAAALVAVAFLI
jgi:DNA-directed RNA polymerase subunit RPC12/RpoP